MLKRIFDFTSAILGLLLLSPVLIVIALLILIRSGWPVFYCGERTGLHGRPFKIIKFRTMCREAESQGTTSTVNDGRITRVGFFLRKYKLDELPQLINVLKGDMSIVGPRPEVAEHTNEYTEEERKILNVLPGITDYSSIEFYNLAEVLGSDNPHQVYVSTIRAKKNRLRLKYVENQSFPEDFKIIFTTLCMVLSLPFRRKRNRKNGIREIRQD
ncbi:MAG: sugar transferase [Verrucomicrobia bacterium]|nr:sugar transferase [Verrucomicrobiota bacterium]